MDIAPSGLSVNHGVVCKSWSQICLSREARWTAKLKQKILAGSLRRNYI